MKPLLLYFLCLLSANILWAQARPGFLPEDIEPTTLDIKCLCRPGVINKSPGKGLALSFLSIGSSPMNEEEGFPLTGTPSSASLQQFSLKLRLPVINKEGFKVLLGTMYRPEHYDFRSIGTDYQPVFQELNDRTLKSAGFEGILSKSWNEKHYTSVRARLLYNGDYKGWINWNSDYAIYNVSAVFGVKKNEYKEWGVGLNFSTSFRTTLLLPFFMYNRTFNQHWGIEMVLPALITVRYNWLEGTTLFGGLRYNSRSYVVDTKEVIPQRYHLNHSEVRAALRIEQRIHPWVWLEVDLGIQYNFSTDFDAPDDAPQSFQVEPGTAPYFKLGVFLSPPKSFMK